MHSILHLLLLLSLGDCLAATLSNHSLLVPVGDGLCPNRSTSAVCDPDHLLTLDDHDTIQSLIAEAYQTPVSPCRQGETIQSMGVQLGVYLRRHDRPHDQEEVAMMRFEWGIGEHTACGNNNGVLLYLVIAGAEPHVYFSPGDAVTTILNGNVLQSVEDGMKPYLRHELYGQAIQAGILDLTAFVRGDKHLADFKEECLRDFYVSSWFFIFLLYCCGGRLLMLVLHIYGRRGGNNGVVYRLHRAFLRQEVEEKLQEIEEFYKHKYPHHQGEYMAQCCPICLEVFPSTKAVVPEANEETPLIFEKNQMGSDGKALLSLPCGHVFDHSCIVDWMVTLRSKNREARLSCPICMEKF